VFGAIARFTVRRRALVLGLYAVFVPITLSFAGSVLPLLKAGGFEDADQESWQTFELIQREFGTGTGDIIALYSAPTGTVDDPEVIDSIITVITRLEKETDVGAVANPYAIGAPHFFSRDRSKTILVIDLLGDEQKKIETFRRLRPVFAAKNLTVQFGGLIPTNASVFQTIQRDLTRAELLAFPLTALVVLLIFGSPGAVAVLLAAGGCGVVFAFAALRAIVAFEDVSVFAINTVMLLGLGLAVDYSLFLVNRFREELPVRGVDGAIVSTIATTGRAVAFSGITVAASLCGLFVFEQMMLRSLALGGIVVVLGTVVIALTLVPALLAVIGERIDAWRVPFLRFEHNEREQANPWYRTALAVMKRPASVAILVSSLLLVLALPFARFDGTMADWRVLPAGDPVRVTNELLEAEFVANQSTPHLVLVTMQGDAMSRANIEQLAALSERMSSLQGISRVDGVFTLVPGVSSADVADILLSRDSRNERYEALLATFVKGPWMRFTLLSERPFDHKLSLEQARALRAISTPGMRVQVAGYAAALIDLKAAIRERTPWMLLLVMVIMFIILFFAFGSITLPIKAMLMTALSLTASFGAIVWIFQDGRLQWLLDYSPLGFSDITLPLVMFAVVFGLSMDYGVLLLARVREEYLRSGDNTNAVALGLARTGRLITSAGALLIVVVAAFSTSQLLFMKALGVGMALAIFLDVTIVRAMLVPATMRLMGRWNWYAPWPLTRLWKISGMSDIER
jgi:RND superfamily putative drug exporter